MFPGLRCTAITVVIKYCDNVGSFDVEVIAKTCTEKGKLLVPGTEKFPVAEVGMLSRAVNFLRRSYDCGRRYPSNIMML
jgi:hypothetical protein